MEEDTTVFIHVDDEIAQLGPLQDHDRKLGGLMYEIGAHLSGADAFGDRGTLGSESGQASHGHQPVEQGQCGANAHGGGVKAQASAEGLCGGEHSRLGLQLQKKGLAVLQLLDHTATDLPAADGGGHLPFNVLAVIAGVEGRDRGKLRGHGDGEGHLLHGVGEAI